MRLKSEATIEDLRHVPDDGKAELVNGELVVTSPAGGLHNYAAHQITMSLHAHCQRQKKGYAIGDNCGFVVDLPNRKSFSPDAAYHLGPLTHDSVSGRRFLRSRCAAAMIMEPGRNEVLRQSAPTISPPVRSWSGTLT